MTNNSLIQREEFVGTNGGQQIASRNNIGVSKLQHERHINMNKSALETLGSTSRLENASISRDCVLENKECNRKKFLK